MALFGFGDRLSGKNRQEEQPVIIKCEGDNSTFIWKHPEEDFRYGAQLIVHESQEAVFFRDGEALDQFGPGRYTLETQQLPLLGGVASRAPQEGDVLHSQIYFINKTVQMGIKWGTPDKVHFIDPLTDTPLQLGASGSMNIQVDNSRRLLIKLVGTSNGIAWGEGPGLTRSLQASFRPLIASAVKINLPKVINQEEIDIFEIDSRLDVVADRLRAAILPGFREYGLTIPQFHITAVVLPEDDPNFRRIRELHTVTLQKRMYQAEADIETDHRQAVIQHRITEEIAGKRNAEPTGAYGETGAWDCPCGRKGNTGNYCGGCGGKRTAPVPAGAWDCVCGMKAAAGRYCTNCGRKRSG